jgi:hypothetical protein
MPALWNKNQIGMKLIIGFILGVISAMVILIVIAKQNQEPPKDSEL